MQEHDKWLNIAKEDLMAAKALIKIELYTTVMYHCQQAAEKALKGYLVFKIQPVTKTHDLLILLELCLKFDVCFAKLYEATKNLNKFSTQFRYPTEYEIPDFAESEIAIKQSQSIMAFVIKKIEEPETGQSKIFEKQEIS